MGTGRRSQLDDQCLPGLDQRGAGRVEALVPDVERCRDLWLEPPARAPEQRRPLSEDPIDLLDGSGGLRVDHRQGLVEEPSALGRPSPDHPDVLR